MNSLMSHAALLVACATLMACAAHERSPQGCGARNPLVGTWRIVSFEDRASPLDAWVTGFGGRPTGYLTYTSACTMAFQAGGPLRHADGLVGSDPAAGYAAYFGTYRINAGDGMVTHHVQGALQPMPDSEPRPFVLNGDTLVLGDGRTWRRTFVRIRQ